VKDRSKSSEDGGAGDGWACAASTHVASITHQPATMLRASVRQRLCAVHKQLALIYIPVRSS